MSQIIPIYIPTYISSVDYQPARVLPRLLYYNGQVDCEPFYVKSGGSSIEVKQFPYFDNYSKQSGSASPFPTTGSHSLLFFNEQPVYGQEPTGSLYTEYWEDYVELLYNPRTRILNASAIIPLADYFKMELNDLVEFRGNYYHLRAINDYNLKNGECRIQLLGPILPQALPFAQDAVPFTPQACCTPTITSIEQNGANVEINFTLPEGNCLNCIATTIQLSTNGTDNWYGNNTAGCTSPRVITAPTSSVYYRITQICEGSVESAPSDAEFFTPTTTTTTTTTTTLPPAECECYCVTYDNSLPNDLYVRFRDCSTDSIETVLINSLPAVDNGDGTYTACICVKLEGSYSTPVCVQNNVEVTCDPYFWVVGGPCSVPGDCFTTTTTTTTTSASATIDVYGIYYGSSANIEYSINGGTVSPLGAPGSSCAYIDTISGLTSGDTVTFTCALTEVISGDTSACPGSASGCSYIYNVTSGTNTVYLAVNGNINC